MINHIIVVNCSIVQKNNFFDGCSWFKFNNLGLPLGMALKFYASVTKVLKLKVRKFWGLILTFVEVTGEKLVGMLFAPPSSIGLNIIKYQLVEKLEKSSKTKNCSLITICQQQCQCFYPKLNIIIASSLVNYKSL